MDKNYTNKIGVDLSEFTRAKREIALSLKEIAAGIILVYYIFGVY